MKLIFSPVVSDDVLSLFRITDEFRVLGSELSSKLLNTITCNSEFMSLFIISCSIRFPDAELYGNSFIQADSVRQFAKLAPDSEIHVLQCDTKQKYKSKDQYLYMYKSLKNEKFSNIYLNSFVSQQSSYSLNQLLKLTLTVWRYFNMGAITDAISKALSSISSLDVNEPDLKHDEDAVVKAMEILGMNTQGVTELTTTDISNDKIDNFINPPSFEETEETEETEEDVNTQYEQNSIFCKMGNGNMVIMVPDGLAFDSTNVGGEKFLTLTFEIPDLESHKLQELNLLGKSDNVCKLPQVSHDIKRVPIILNNSETHTNEKHNNIDNNSVIEALRSRKQKLDELIKEARSNNDSNLLEDLRKERRKIRSEINKLS